jgi:hypothetical protein
VALIVRVPLVVTGIMYVGYGPGSSGYGLQRQQCVVNFNHEMQCIAEICKSFDLVT